MNEDLLALIYELINRRDLSPEREHLIIEELEIHGCCENRIEFERRILLRFREASADGGCCPERLKKKVIALLENIG
jgi:hypothetical protein